MKKVNQESITQASGNCDLVKNKMPTLNPLSRDLNGFNHGTRCRKMNKAARYLLISEHKASFASAATNQARYRIFEEFVNVLGIRSMNDLDLSHVMIYADHLVDRIEREEITVKTAKNYLSAVNTVHRVARRDKTLYVAPSDFFPRLSQIRTESKAISEETLSSVLENLAQLRYQDLYHSETSLSEVQRAAADRLTPLIKLQHYFGLRIKEALLFDAATAYDRARYGAEEISIERGTKGGRRRSVPIRDSRGVDVLREAAKAQRRGDSMIPEDFTLGAFKQACYQVASMIKLPGFHRLRHAYAQERYREMSGVPCPLESGRAHGRDHYDLMAEHLGIELDESKEVDSKTREQLAEELGHGRRDVTNSYTG